MYVYVLHALFVCLSRWIDRAGYTRESFIWTLYDLDRLISTFRKNSVLSRAGFGLAVLRHRFFAVSIVQHEYAFGRDNREWRNMDGIAAGDAQVDEDR